MDESKEKLRSVRDRVAALGPRIRLRPDASHELKLRISSMATQIDAVLRLVATRAIKPVENLEDTIEDTVAEARLLIHELERLLETAPKGLGAARPGGAERRQHERLETNVTVRLLRHVLNKNDADGGVSLSTETARRPALNVSSGGIFIALPMGELPQVGVGNLLHVEVETPEIKFSARASVARRDANGVGLSWILDEDRTRRAVQTLLAAVRGGNAHQRLT